MNRKNRLCTALLAVLISLSMIAGIFPFAFAAEITPENKGAGISSAASTDRSFYFIFDKAKASFKITNISGKPVLAHISACSEGLELVGSEGFEPFVTIEAGSTYTAELDLQLSSKAPDLNFFARMLLAVRDLFSKGTAITDPCDKGEIAETSADYLLCGKYPVKLCVEYMEIDFSGLEKDPDAASRKIFEDLYLDLLSKDAFTLKILVKETGGSSTYNIPILMAKKGDRMYTEVSYPIDEFPFDTMTMKAYLKKDKASIYIPEIRGTFTLDMREDEFTNLLNSVKEGGDTREDYMGSAKSGGMTFDYYGTENDYAIYMYEGNNLRRVEQVSKDKDGKITTFEITEIVELSDSADSKLFVEPTGYINMDKYANDFDLERAINEGMAS